MKIIEKLLNSKLFVVFTILLLTAVFIPSTKAAGLTSLSDSMSRLKASTASNHTIQFTAPSNWDVGDTVSLTFDSGFDLTGLSNADATDYDINTGTEETIVVSGNCASSDAIEITSISGQVITFTACPNYTAPGISSTISFEIGSNAITGGTGNTQITNPTAGTKVISIAGTFGDTGSVAVAIISDDQIPVSASVDSTLTLTVANTTLALGAMNDSAVATTSENNIVVGTNGYHGYAITVKDAGNGSSPGLYSSGVSKLIASSTATLAAGTEGYGANCNKTSGDGTCLFANGATDNVTGLALAGGTFASHSSKPSGNATFRIRVKAAIASSTDSGTYSDTLTVIGTANY